MKSELNSSADEESKSASAAAAAAASSAGAIDPDAQRERQNFRMITQFRPMLYASFLDTDNKNNNVQTEATEQFTQISDALLVVEAPWLSILASLPQPLARHRYGT